MECKPMCINPRRQNCPRGGDKIDMDWLWSVDRVTWRCMISELSSGVCVYDVARLSLVKLILATGPAPCKGPVVKES